MAVLCQELFGFPAVMLTLSLDGVHASGIVIGLLPQYTPRLTNSFILRFASLSWIRPGPRLNLAAGCQGIEARRLDSRPLPQSRPDDPMAEETGW